MYSKVVLNVFNNPKNAGRISKPDGIADCYNEDNTAHVEFSLRIDNGIISECKFRAQANPYIVAICSTITNMLKGKMVAMALLDQYSIKQELGDETDINIDFCIDCVKFAIQDYKEKLEKSNKQTKKTEEIITKDVTEDNFETITKEDDEKAEEKAQNNLEDNDDYDFSDFFDDDMI